MSARPGRILAEIPVPFGYPRPTELRFEPDFANVAGQISARLREKLSMIAAAPREAGVIAEVSRPVPGQRAGRWLR